MVHPVALHIQAQQLHLFLELVDRLDEPEQRLVLRLAFFTL